MIACVNSIGAIGYKNKLMFDFPKDMKHFKDTTTGHIVVMGYNTYKSLPKFPLPNRLNVVIADEPNDIEFIDNVIVFPYLEKCLEHFKNDKRDIFIIGGGQLYREAMEYADELLITEVPNVSLGDTYFPNIPLDFKIVSRKVEFDTDKNTDCEYRLEFRVYRKERNEYIHKHFKQVSSTEWVSRDGKFEMELNHDKSFTFKCISPNINNKAVKEYMHSGIEYFEPLIRKVYNKTTEM